MLRPAFLSAAAAVACAGSLGWLLRFFYHDDAYIALRYARNLLRGQGLVWNAGERVEGYTSILWVLGCAALGRLGLDIETASRLLGATALAGLLVLLGRQGSRAGQAACLLAASSGPLVAWSLGGLETAGFTLLLTGALLAAEKLWPQDGRGDPATVSLDRGGEPRASEPHSMVPPEPAPCALGFGVGALFALAELCRPEAALFFVFLLGALLLMPCRAGCLRLATVCLLGFAALFLPRLAWRVWYYGDLLPNTFYVKAGSTWEDLPAGLAYLGRAVLLFPVPALLYAAAWKGWRLRPLSRGERVLTGSVVLYLAYVAWIGGDHMPWFRFIAPVLPISYLLAARRLDAGAERTGLPATAGRLFPRRPGRLFPAALAALNMSVSAALAYGNGWMYRDAAARSGTLVGLYIHDHWPDSALVALNTAGSTAYFSDLRCIDMLGLNDRHIARRRMPPVPAELPWARLPGHHKGDGAYVLSRRPDFIILGGSEGYMDAWFVGDREILESPEFLSHYVPREAWIPGRDRLQPVRFRYFERVERIASPR